MTTTVINIAQHEAARRRQIRADEIGTYFPDHIFIGRPSIWGNPFLVGIHGTREEVIDKYTDYLMEHGYLLNRLPMLRDKVLVCFCKPLACHGDVLVKLVEEGSV